MPPRAISTDTLRDLQGLKLHLHRHPELPGNEHETEAFIIGQLKEAGISEENIRRGPGVVAHLGPTGGPTISFRTAIDGLPLTESADAPTPSTRAGIMHACGHDAGTAVLLTLARLLHRQPNPPSTRLIFQPAEETLVGAQSMLDAQLVQFGADDAVLSFHLDPTIAEGVIGVSDGRVMAGVFDFTISIQAGGGHVSVPHLSTDAIAAGAAIVTELPAVVSSAVSPLEPVTLAIGRFDGGKAANIIAQTAKLEGTLRFGDKQVGAAVQQAVNARVAAIAGARRVTATVEWVERVPALQNDRSLAERVNATLRETFGARRVVEHKPCLAADDAAFFHQRARGVYWLIGSGRAEGPTPPLHHPSFAFSDECMVVALQSCLAVAALFSEADTRPRSSVSPKSSND